jgi:hypothetical protein
MTVRLKYFLVSAALFVLASGGFGQRKELVDVPWAPPADLDLPGDVAPNPTVPQAMITALRLGHMSIRLERTELAAVRERFGGEEGSQGDAGSALGWLCYAGQDAAGRWALWLTSGEIDGPSIGSFEWRRVAENAHFDPRCAQLPRGTDVTLSLIPLQLGMSERKVFESLGKPTTRRGDILDYEHNEEKHIGHETYDFWNSIALRLVDGTVDSIRATETDAD